jgi:hypothetical protein
MERVRPMRRILVSRRAAAPWNIRMLCGVVLFACSCTKAAEPSHELTLHLPGQSPAAGHRFQLSVDRADPLIADLPQVVELTSRPAISPAEPWAVVVEAPVGNAHDFTPMWRAQQDGSLLLSWGGEDTAITISVASRGARLWVGTVTYHSYDGTETTSAVPAQLELQS